MAGDDDGRRRWWRDFPPGRPREARGGIKAHTRRGAFGRTWWARRWLEALERLELGGRLARGRSYARRGQVLDVAVEEGRVRASVQGSRQDPYQVTLRVRPLAPEAWRAVGDALRREARFAARLLASEMPEDVEEAFAQAGVPLFPASRAELETSCSCPDWSNPCKHIAAVYYLLGEEFERDPFLIFLLRGLPREGVDALLGGRRERPRPSRGRGGPAPPAPPSADPASFWSGGDTPVPEEMQVPATPAALLHRLGPFPFWRGEQPLAAALAPAYVKASAQALEVYLGTGRPGR